MAIPLYHSDSVFEHHPGLRGHVVSAEGYKGSTHTHDSSGDVLIVGMVNYEGKISKDRANTLRQLFGMAGSLSRLALLSQILVIRPEERRVIVCDYYRYATEGDSRHNLPLRPRDIVVVPRLYSEERYLVAPEWGPIERYFTRQISREELYRALDR
jgi:hypothetical protein|tara:strand:+ start:1084 stop:1551 length:468 start_codon:yes stop_codon:yes gene_type:complete